MVLLFFGAIGWMTVFNLGASSDEGGGSAARVQARINSFDIMVRCIGTLDAGEAHMVASSLKGGDGKIIDLVDDGTVVKSGDVLVEMDPAPFEEEILNLEGQIKRLQVAAEAKNQLFEWEKNQVVKELGTAQFKVKTAGLELEKYKNGEGPLKLIQFSEEMEKVQKDREKYSHYLNDLKRLSQDGYEHPGEIAKAEQELLGLEEHLKSAKRKVESYQNYVLPSTIEKLETDVSQAQMEEEQVKKGSVHQIAQAKSFLDEAEVALANRQRELAEAKKKLTQTVITAPSDGIVILYEAFRNGQKRKPRIGDSVLQNQPILYLPDISSMIVKTRIREVDLHKVKVGQECTVTVEAYPDKKIMGRVSFIGALASEGADGTRGARYFQMTIRLTSSDPDLRPGMTSRIRILADRVENVISLPVHTIFEDGGGRAYCYKFQNGKYAKIPIKVGRENEDLVEILEGIIVGDWVSTLGPDLRKSL